MSTGTIKPGKTRDWFGYFFIVFLAVMPLVYSSKGIDPNLLPRQIAVSLFIIVSGVVLMIRATADEHRGVRTFFPYLFVSLALCYWWSVTNAINPVEAKYVALKISLYVSAFIVTCFLLKAGIIQIHHIAAGFTVGLAFTVVLALRDAILLQQLGFKLMESDHVYKINATFGHKNLLSAYLLFSLPFAILQFRSSKSKLVKGAIALLAVAALALIVLLQTRAVLLAMLVSGVFTATLVALMYRGRQRKVISLLVLLGVVVLASGLYVTRNKLSVITRTESFKERAALWQNSWQMIREHPQGVGAGNWQIWLPKYGIQKFYDFNYRVSEGLTTFQRPHNDFLWVAAETGIAGGMIYLALFVLLLWYCIKKLNSELQGDTRFVYLILSALVVAYGIVALVDFPLERMEHSLLFTIVAAIIISGVDGGRLFVTIPRWMFAIPAALALYSIYVSAGRWKSEGYLVKMYRAHAQHDWQQLATNALKAETDQMNMDYFSLPISWYAGVASFSLGDVPTAKKYFSAAYEINPYQVHVLNNLGVCYEKEKNYEKALPLLEQAHRISPTFSDGISTLAGAYYNIGRYDDAWIVMSQFKYDENNPQFKLFATAIIKSKLWAMAEKTQNEKEKARLIAFAGSDALLMDKYHEAQQKGVPFFKYLLAQHE